ncbi:hypothetical protein MKX54_11135 [Alkalihalobacillus sp. FSL R5-0424]
MSYHKADGTVGHLDKDQTFYLFNHVAVLGIDLGAQRVAKRFGMKVNEVLMVFFQIHKKAHHLAR